MALDRIAIAQRGIGLAAAEAASAPGKRRAQSVPTTLTGPFLSPGTLSRAERLRLIDGIERVLEGVYAHLPLKRARYAFDPAQRLRILRTQLDALEDDAFHNDLADILTRLRDAHTRYAGPSNLAHKVAALPFLVEMIGSSAAPVYVVTKVGAGLDATFKPGVQLEYWNGVPIDRAVQRYSDNEVGGRPDSQRAWATQSLTLRSLQYGPPPDEHWVIVGYRAGGERREVKIPWQIVDPTQVDAVLSEAPGGRAAKALRRNRAIDPAAAAIRRVKMLLFAPGALVGEQACAATPLAKGIAARKAPPAEVIATRLTDTLKAMAIAAPGGPYGYLRIYGFDTVPERFIAELLRLIPLLPDKGLIIDVRGNPGGYIWAAEQALQLFTPKAIQTTRFSLLATPFTREMAELAALREDLAPWKPSLDAAVRNGELYSQPIPITDMAASNAIGQQYGGPVVLVGDATTYSAGDLFAAGFVDNGIGPFVCVGEATGAGGANVWDYAELRSALADSPIALPALADGIGLSFSFRRATRAGPSEGLPIEDVGVAGAPYAMTRDDLLAGNRDLIAHCVSLLRQRPLTRLGFELDRRARSLSVTTLGLDRVDMLIDGHPGSSQRLGSRPGLTFEYPPGTETIELAGFAGPDLRQRRRIAVKR